MAQLNFDSTNVQPASANDPIPAGWYTAHITASELKPTANGSGSYLSLELTVLAPAEYAGRKVFDRINRTNSNPVAVEIGDKQLSAICHATGVIQVQDSVQLHNRPIQVKVSLRAAQTPEQSNDGKAYDASNEVKGYKAVEGATVASQAAPAYAPPPVVAPQAPAPNWAPPAPVQQAPAYAPPAAPVYAPPAAPVQAAPAYQPAPHAPVAGQPAWAAAVPQPTPQVAAPAPVQQAPAVPQAAASTPPWLQQPAQ